VVIVERQSDAAAEPLDLGAHRGLVARVDDAKLRRKNRLADDALD
jgi:hypothetical protein